MTDAEKLIMLKTIVGESDIAHDTELTVYLTLAKGAILNRAYPFNPERTEIPQQYDTLQCEIAAYLWNKRGAEGELTHSENGISRSYENGNIPRSMLAAVTPCCGTFREVTE